MRPLPDRHMETAPSSGTPRLVWQMAPSVSRQETGAVRVARTDATHVALPRRLMGVDGSDSLETLPTTQVHQPLLRALRAFVVENRGATVRGSLTRWDCPGQARCLG